MKSIPIILHALASWLQKKKPVQEFFSEFTAEAVKWIKPLFIRADGTPVDEVTVLQQDPESDLATHAKAALEFKLAMAAKRDEVEQALFAMGAQLEKNSPTGTSITNSKNVNNGNISAGGDVHLGDKNG